MINQLEFAEKWIADHFEPQPPTNPSITWCVGAWACFRHYANAADRAGYQPFTLPEFGRCLVMLFPHVKGKTLKGNPVYTGVHYFEDAIGGKMVMGI
jgi:hypothetical protein